MIPCFAAQNPAMRQETALGWFRKRCLRLCAYERHGERGLLDGFGQRVQFPPLPYPS